MHKYLKGYHLDLRSLALMRILLATFLIVELGYYFFYQEAFLYDFGVMSRSSFIKHHAQPWSWSLFYIAGHGFVINALLAIGFISAIFVLIGYRTKFFTILSWVFLVSLHNRNWFLINAGDDLLRVVFFLAIFLPWGNYFSIDHALAKNQENVKTKIYHPVSYWLIVQIGIVYFFSYFYKTDAMWRSEFTAVDYALQLDIFRTFIGDTVSEWKGFLKALTAFIIYLELIGPILLVFHGLLFKFKDYLRTFIIFLFVLFHLGLILTMTIGQFPYICIGVWLGLLPSSFWNFFKKKKSKNDKTIYYDGNCGFCLKGVLLLKELFRLEFDVFPAQVNNAILRKMDEYNSWVVFDKEKDQFYYRYQAFTKLLENKFYQILFNNKLMEYLGEKFYLMVSHNRSLFSRLTVFFKRSYLNTGYTYKTTLIMLFFVSGIIIWNINSLAKFHITSWPHIHAIRYFHLYQHWDMFSPNTKMDDTWYVIEGTFKDNHKEMLFFSNEVLIPSKTKFVNKVRDKYWRKTFANMSGNAQMKKHFSLYLCRLYNIKKFNRKRSLLVNVRVREYSQMNTLDGTVSEINEVVVNDFKCYE